MPKSRTNPLSQHTNSCFWPESYGCWPAAFVVLSVAALVADLRTNKSLNFILHQNRTQFFWKTERNRGRTKGRDIFNLARALWPSVYGPMPIDPILIAFCKYKQQ